MTDPSRYRLIAAFLCIAALFGCASKPASFAEQDPHVDLYAFKTFSFMEPAPGLPSGAPPGPPSGAGYSTLVDQRLKEATRAQLEGLGYVYDESNAELRVNIVLAVQDRAEIRSTPNAGPMGYMGWGASNIETVQYRYGTLVIDLVDAKRRTMVWRGVAGDRITRKNMQDVDGTVRDAVRELFAKYPRKA
jgi:hypothetical protein